MKKNQFEIDSPAMPHQAVRRTQDGDHADPGAALDLRAFALVNPVSGLANDYLNLFNEIIMLVENYPVMPELGDAIRAWVPVSYREYFRASSLPGRASALEAYECIEPGLRQAFEAILAEIAHLASGAAAQVGHFGADEHLHDLMASFCAQTSAAMMSCLARATHIVNYGTIQHLDNPQERADTLLTRRQGRSRRRSD